MDQHDRCDDTAREWAREAIAAADPAQPAPSYFE